MTALKQLGVSLSDSQIARIEALAKQRGVSRAEFVRQLVDVALPLAEDVKGVDYKRLALLIEFLNLAVQELLDNKDPALKTPMIKDAMARAREHHGA